MDHAAQSILVSCRSSRSLAASQRCLLAPRIPVGTVSERALQGSAGRWCREAGLAEGLAACGAERQASRKAAQSTDAQPPLRTQESRLPVRASAKHGVGRQSSGAFCGGVASSSPGLRVGGASYDSAPGTLEHSALYLLVQYRQHLLHCPEAGASVGCWLG